MEAQNRRAKILLGLTGSVASTLYGVLIDQLQKAGYTVDVILTEKAQQFIDTKGVFPPTIHRALSVLGAGSYTDQEEWYPERVWCKGDPILHVNLADEYSALVIAPCSANTLAKISNGICDNLLTSVARVWPWYKPLIIAPAMNTRMWDHPITTKHLGDFRSFSNNNTVVRPQSKVLACGTEGMGALADISSIVHTLDIALGWGVPLNTSQGLTIPVPPHPGAFAANRAGYKHTGVDLYADEDTGVYAVEDGEVVAVGNFTGPSAGSPRWKDTQYVMVRGASGVILYGELWYNVLSPGVRVHRGSGLGRVARVIREGKEHPEITGWKPSMLHLELYRWDATEVLEDFDGDILRDPTPYLLMAFPHAKRVTWTRE